MISIVNERINEEMLKQFHVLSDTNACDELISAINIPKGVVNQFFKKANELNEGGSLYPKYNLSVLPIELINTEDNEKLKNELYSFLQANKEKIKSQKIYIELNISREANERFKELLTSIVDDFETNNLKEIVIKHT